MSSWNTPRRRTAWGAAPSRARTANIAGADPLFSVVDACLAGVIFVAPLVLGGRHDLGRLVFIALAGVAATAWFVRQALRGESSEPRWSARIVFGLAVLLVAFQLVPLPAAWLAWLSPRTAELLPLWTGAPDSGELGAWSTLSLAPQATRLSLAMLVAYGLLFFTVAARIRDEGDVARLVKWIGLSAGLMAAIGLVQFFAPNGKFLWIYEHPSRDASGRLSGPFANRNHFAHFLALGLPALAAWLTLRLHRSPSQVDRFSCATGSASVRRPSSGHAGRASGTRVASWLKDGETLLAGGLLVLVAATALLSYSRGGILAVAVAAGVVVLALQRTGLLDGRRAAALVAAGALVFLAISLTGYERIAERLSSLSAQSLDELDESSARRRIWQANVAAIGAGGWFGSGVGSHADIYPVYLADPPTKQYTHAESGYLQILTENGVPGGVLLAAVLTLVAAAAFRALRGAASPQAKACAAAATAALAASAVHSLCDFVWYIPACLSIAIVLAACLVRLGELAAPATTARPVVAIPRRLATAQAVAVALATVAAAIEFIGPAAASLHWDSYLRQSSAHREFTHKLLAMPPEAAAPALAEARAAEQAALEAMIAELESVVRRYPGCASAHSALANRCLQLFNLNQLASDNPMPASQISGAAVNSQFRSSAELREWLNRAVGDNGQWLDRALAHSRTAVRLAPLEGEAYAALAEVCFLRGEGPVEADGYLAQAMRVRPYDGDLLFEIGVQWNSRGVIQPGLDCYERAFRLEGPHRVQVARCLAGQLSTAAVIRDLAPEWDTLAEFWRAARASTPADREALLAYAEAQARRETPALVPAQAALVWRTLAQMEYEAARPERALSILAHSARAYPQDYSTRRVCGFALAEAGRLDEAVPHLQWCLQRRPDDTGVQQILIRTGRQRLAVRPR